jgi:predicted small lipoprotein YifL
MPRLIRLSLVLGLALGLAACGKRGQLDAPPSQSQASQAQQGVIGADGQVRTQRPKRTPIVAPKRELFIDALLD